MIGPELLHGALETLQFQRRPAAPERTASWVPAAAFVLSGGPRL